MSTHEIPACWSEPLPAAADESDGWKSYWEQLDDRQTTFRVQSQEYVENLTRSLPLDPGMRVLDFGCGFCHVAEMLAPRVGELFLWDATANMRRHARARMARFANVRYLDLSRPDESLPDPRLDLILVNSVCQYMTPEEFSGWLGHWRRLLGPGGRVVVSDLIPPEHRGSRELFTLLKFSARRGFLLRAVWQALGEVTRYHRTRQSRPLTRFSKDDLTRRGAAAGLRAEFLPRNLTHFPARITAIFSPAP